MLQGKRKAKPSWRSGVVRGKGRSKVGTLEILLPPSSEVVKITSDVTYKEALVRRQHPHGEDGNRE